MLKKISFLLVILALFPLGCYGNSAEPPSIVVIVSDAPEDLAISIESKDANKTKKTFETYYTFYLSDLEKVKEYNLKITTESKSFEILLDKPLTAYNNIFTLDLKEKELIPGKSLKRSITLVSLRMILTIIIEAMVFFLFGYRQRRSWSIFIITNLITQGFLNVWLNGFSPLNNYIVISLVIAEIQIFIFELFAFVTFIKEYSRIKTSIYVLLANVLSLIVGGYIITILPI